MATDGRELLQTESLAANDRCDIARRAAREIKLDTACFYAWLGEREIYKSEEREGISEDSHFAKNGRAGLVLPRARGEFPVRFYISLALTHRQQVSWMINKKGGHVVGACSAAWTRRRLCA